MEGNMANSVRRPFLQARLADTSQIPATALQKEMLVAIFILAALAYITYGLRMYTRITCKLVGLEDWLMTAATINSMALVSWQYFYFRYSYVGFPDTEIPKGADVESSLFSTWLNQLLYSPILGLVKSSTLVFMLRIVGHVRNIKITIHVINAINAILTLSVFLASLFINVPIASYWDRTIPVKHKIYTEAFILSSSFLIILTDILVLSIPFWVFIRTQLPLSTRLGVITVFMTGGIVTAIGIVRTCMVTETYFEPEFRFTNLWGPSFGAIETSLAIITACLPALLPLLRAWFPRIFRNSRSQASQGRRYHPQRRTGNEASIRMQEFSHKRGNIRFGSKSTAESREHLFTSAGIRKTTDIQVSYSTRKPQNSGETARNDTPGPSDPVFVV